MIFRGVSSEAPFFWLVLYRMNQRLKKGEKLKSRKQIKFLFEKNQNVFVYPIKYIWEFSSPKQDYPVQVLVSIPKRNFKRAVDRNRLKRLLREAYRKNKDIIYDNLNLNNKSVLLGLLYVGKEILTYDEIEKSVRKALLKIKENL